MSVQLPTRPTPNEQALAGWTRERFTGLSGTAVTLSRTPIAGLELVFFNGTALDPNGGASGYSLNENVVTLGTAAVAGDVFLIWYLARST